MNFSLKKPLQGFFDRDDTFTKPLVVFYSWLPALLPCLAAVRASIAAIPSTYRNKKIASLYALLGGNAFVFFNAIFDALKPICSTEHSRHRSDVGLLDYWFAIFFNRLANDLHRTWLTSFYKRWLYRLGHFNSCAYRDILVCVMSIEIIEKTQNIMLILPPL